MLRENAEIQTKVYSISKVEEIIELESSIKGSHLTSQFRKISDLFKFSILKNVFF